MATAGGGSKTYQRVLTVIRISFWFGVLLLLLLLSMQCNDDVCEAEGEAVDHPRTVSLSLLQHWATESFSHCYHHYHRHSLHHYHYLWHQHCHNLNILIIITTSPPTLQEDQPIIWIFIKMLTIHQMMISLGEKESLQWQWERWWHTGEYKCLASRPRKMYSITSTHFRFEHLWTFLLSTSEVYSEILWVSTYYWLPFKRKECARRQNESAQNPHYRLFLCRATMGPPNISSEVQRGGMSSILIDCHLLTGTFATLAFNLSTLQFFPFQRYNLHSPNIPCTCIK